MSESRVHQINGFINAIVLAIVALGFGLTVFWITQPWIMGPPITNILVAKPAEITPGEPFLLGWKSIGHYNARREYSYTLRCPLNDGTEYVGTVANLSGTRGFVLPGQTVFFNMRYVPPSDAPRGKACVLHYHYDADLNPLVKRRYNAVPPIAIRTAP